MRPALFLLCIIAVCSCQQKQPVHSYPAVYRHYVGTIGDEPAEVCLYQFSSSDIRGYFFYLSEGVIHNLDNYKDEDHRRDNVVLTETHPLGLLGADDKGSAITWTVEIRDDSINGLRQGAQLVDVGRIRMREEHSHTTQFSIKEQLDDLEDGWTTRKTGSMFSLISLPQMPRGPRKSRFLTQVICSMLCSNCADASVEASIRARNKQMFASDLRIADPGVYSGGFDAVDELDVVYDHGNVLAFQLAHYLGGNPLVPVSLTLRSVNLDEQVVLSLTHVLRPDTAAILSAIKDALTWKMGGATALTGSQRAALDSVALSGNFYCTHKGLVFGYKALPVSLGIPSPALLYVSYRNLVPLLRADFKKRMHLADGEEQEEPAPFVPPDSSASPDSVTRP